MIVSPLPLTLPRRPRVRRAVPARGRAARAAVLWGVAAVVLAHLGLAAAVETVLPQLRDPEYGYRLVRIREQQRLHPDRPLVLVMGSSRTANGFDPRAAGFPDEPGSPLLFNFGMAGGGPLHLRTHLERLRADGVNPDVLLIELSPVMLVADLPDDIQYLLVASKLTAGDLRRVEPRLDNPAPVRRAWRVSRLNVWQSHRLAIVSHILPEALPWRERLNHYWANTDRFGYDAYPEYKSDELRAERTARARGTYFGLAQRGQVSGSANRAARELLAVARARGAPVAIFTTPESPTFRAWYAPEAQPALTAYLRALSAELGVPVFEAPDDFTDADFGDGHHMLPGAATRFTRHLTDRHLKPWLATVRK